MSETGWHDSGAALEAARDHSTAPHELAAIVALHRTNLPVLLAVAENPSCHRTLLLELASIGYPALTGATKRHPNR
jgi:hypothetical protein